MSDSSKTVHSVISLEQWCAEQRARVNDFAAWMNENYKPSPLTRFEFNRLYRVWEASRK